MLRMGDELTRQEISDAVTSLGWRLVLGLVRTGIPAESLAESGELAARAIAAAGEGADEHLRVDLRPEHVVLSLATWAAGRVTGRDIELAREISTALSDAGIATDPELGPRSPQEIEIAIDALDIPVVRPFWRAVLGYVDEPGHEDDPGASIADPLGQSPTVWFQQMDEPRPQRNRVHLDVSVPHDEARERVRAALSAGGRLVSDERAPAFWVLADPEGNEACVTTWQGRDE